MDFQQNFTCPLCLQLAKQAVQSSCCTKIYCNKCIVDAIKKFNSCPCCRSKDITFKPSNIARKVISQIKISCQHCQLKVQSGEMENHLKKCPKLKIQCRFCKAMFTQQAIPAHTARQHQQQAKDYLIKYVIQHKKSKSSKVIEPPRPAPEDHNYFQPVINKFNRKAALGTPGKYYCGGQLIGKCTCCNGFCGPDDGQNCDACMQLDIKRWNLARTYLINSIGYICQVMRVQGVPRVSCFRMQYVKKAGLFSKGQSITCKIGSSCTSCQQVQNSIKLGRYSHFI